MQWEALSAAFADISIKCSDSPALDVCYFSQEIAYGAEGSKERTERFQHLLRQKLVELATRFIKERNPIAEDLATHPTVCRSKIREAQDQGLVDKPQAKRLLSNNENLDAELLKVRAALARNRIKVEYGSLSQPTHSRIDEAYLPMLAGPVRYQDYKTGAAETAWPGSVQEFGPELLIIPGRAMKTRTAPKQISCWLGAQWLKFGTKPQRQQQRVSWRLNILCMPDNLIPKTSILGGRIENGSRKAGNRPTTGNTWALNEGKYQTGNSTRDLRHLDEGKWDRGGVWAGKS